MKPQEVWLWRGAIFAAAVLGVLAGITGCILGGLALGRVNHFNAPGIIHQSGVLPASPEPLYLDQAAAPLQMTLPSNLADRVGNVYRVWSRTDQPHTLQIAAGTGTTWDGTNFKATLGGAKGDGLVFEVVAPNQIVVHLVRNTVFS